MPNIGQEIIFKYGTQSAYDSLSSPRNTNTLFFTDEGRMFIGDSEYTNQILSGSSLPSKTASPKSLFILKASDGHYEFYYSSTGEVGSWTLVYSTDSVPDGVVRYDSSQSLNSSQKTQARTNIGAASDAELSDHVDDTNNPHSVTKSQIGLGNVDNTSDMNKPVSDPQKKYIDSKGNVSVEGGASITMGSSLGQGPYTIEMTEEDEEESISASQVSYNNVSSGMQSTNVQDAIGELFQSVSEGKSLIAAAVTGMGVETAADATFTQMAENIGKISGTDLPGFMREVGTYSIGNRSITIPLPLPEATRCLIAVAQNYGMNLVACGELTAGATYLFSNYWSASVVERSGSITAPRQGVLTSSDGGNGIRWIFDPNGTFDGMSLTFKVYLVTDSSR